MMRRAAGGRFRTHGDGAVSPAGRQPQFGGDRAQALVAGPQSGARGQACRRQQMGIDIADTAPKQPMTSDKMQNLSVRRHNRSRQS